jgi:hypothetical protein
VAGVVAELTRFVRVGNFITAEVTLRNTSSLPATFTCDGWQLIDEQLLSCMQIQLGEIESAGGYKLQDLRIYNSDRLLITTIAVKLFDQASGRIGPVLELIIDPQKRIFESFDRTDTLFVSIGDER